MNTVIKFLLLTALFAPALGHANLSQGLNQNQLQQAEALYQRYCSLCHGENREGYRADHAPSLRSESLLRTAFPQLLFESIAYGRVNSAMDGYHTMVGGPLSEGDIALLIRWLVQIENVAPINISQQPIQGSAKKGEKIYAKHCASCHGKDGEGVSAPALGDQLFLSVAEDEYIKYAIVKGRDGTPMPSFAETLSGKQINNVVAYLRSQASGWSPEPPKLARWPDPSEYIMNPEGEAPKFTLRQGRYIPAAEIVKALENKNRFILLDTRPGSAWQRLHIPGAVPMPYYRDKLKVAENLPNDDTWIVAYCACPHAASDSVINYLRSLGYPNTGVLDEGILRWIEMGLPVTAGDVTQ